MIDSCSPSKLDPGLAPTNSKPRLLRTSTMKSDAGCSMIRELSCGGGGAVSADSCTLPGDAGTDRVGAAAGGCGSADAAGAVFATSAAAPIAAPFRNRRRLVNLVICSSRNLVIYCSL